MSAVVTPLTVEQFLQLPDKPGVKRELVEGVVVEIPGAAAGHEIVKSNIDEYLVLWNAGQRVGKVFSETMFLLGGAGAYIPDVAGSDQTGSCQAFPVRPGPCRGSGFLRIRLGP